MLREYRFVKRLPKKERLAYIQWLAAAPGELADKFVRSIASFTPYENDLQAFNGSPPVFKPEHGENLTAGVDLAKRLLDGGTCEVGGRRELDLDYVNRELDCLRVARGRGAGGRNLDDGAPSKTALVLDLLLVNVNDRVPIISEVKLGEDKDAAYALIQALAAAAHLATPAQRRRLANIYPDAQFDVAEHRIDVYVISLDRPTRSLDAALHEAAVRVAEQLVERGDVAESIRRIAFLEAQVLDGGQITMEPAAVLGERLAAE